MAITITAAAKNPGSTNREDRWQVRDGETHIASIFRNRSGSASVVWLGAIGASSVNRAISTITVFATAGAVILNFADQVSASRVNVLISDDDIDLRFRLNHRADLDDCERVLRERSSLFAMMRYDVLKSERTINDEASDRSADNKHNRETMLLTFTVKAPTPQTSEESSASQMAVLLTNECTWTKELVQWIGAHNSCRFDEIDGAVRTIAQWLSRITAGDNP